MISTRGSRVGRYLLLDRVGEGGMGVVYKAYDPELDRPIALKLLPAHSTGQSERLLREAQALAQLAHPNVIAVHDVGLIEGDVFIAMEFVDGQNLRRWLEAAPRSQREIVDAFVAAGEGLAAAHRAGLVHRDFKPDNVMIGRDGRARVLDFGLARTAHHPSGTSPASPARDLAASPASDTTTLPTRDVATATPDDEHATATATPSAKALSFAAGEGPTTADISPTGALLTPPTRETAPATRGKLLASNITHVGHIVGTPRFMSPEQLDGHAVDERADQFSFCVSLYWALYKDFPFNDERQSLLLPPPPQATVPRWLRQVLLRGLSQDPAQRFASMDELLAALRADPADALRRRLRAAVGVLAAAALVAAAVAGALAWRVHRGAVQQARLAQKFGEEVAQISSLSRYSALLPLHDTRPEMQLIRARMQHLVEEMDALGPVAVGPGHEALGRGQLALGRWDEALAELERAWASGYRSRTLAYALGMTHGKLYQRGLAALRPSGDAKLDAAARAAVARLHRDPALVYLKEANAGDLGEAPEYVEGLIAFYEQRFDDAAELADKAFARAPWLYEARTLAGDIRLMSARARSWKGDIDGALAELERAGEAYRAAAVVARSSEAAHLGECQRLVERANIEVERDRSPAATVEAALRAGADAVTARPDDSAPLDAQSLAWQYRGTYETRHSVDPTPSLEKSIALAGRALALDPHDAGAEWAAAASSLAIAERRIQDGGDARAALDGAVAHAVHAEKMAPASAADQAVLCHIYATRGQLEDSRGEDPSASFRAAVASAQKGADSAPDSFLAWNALGISNAAVASWESTNGKDPTRDFERSVDAYLHVVRIVPTLDHGFNNLCEVYLNWSMYELHGGIDPRVHLQQARDSCDEAIRINGNYYGSRFDLGEAERMLATWQLEQNIDPSPALQRSRAALERAFAIAGDLAELCVPLGHARLVEARWAALHDGDAAGKFAAAESLGKRALALSHGEMVEAYELLAEAHRWHADWLARRHAPVDAEVQAGLAMATRALGRNPRYATAAAEAGALHLLAARAASTAEARTRAASAARAAFARALAIDGNLAHDCDAEQAEAARLASVSP